MKAFWWYKDNSIAGMARPGFNSCRWFDLPFDEAVLMGWLGQHSSGVLPLESFRSHVKSYVPKMLPFYRIEETDHSRIIDRFQDHKALRDLVSRLSDRSKFIAQASIIDDHLQFEMNRKQVDTEISFLKKENIHRIVSLTEDHHLSDYLSEHFHLNHIAITDMCAPTEEQAQQLAEIIESSMQRDERLAVHCLAGIGRTSTMLMAADLLMGKPLDGLLEHVQNNNPAYKFAGSQAEFLRSLSSKAKKVQVVAAIIQNGPRFLLGRRSLQKKSAPGYWSPITGQIESGETEPAAVERECQEEIGLTVKAVKKVADFEIDRGSAHLNWWLVEKLAGNEFLKNDEHSELRWFTIDEMRAESDFLPEDIEVYAKVALNRAD